MKRPVLLALAAFSACGTPTTDPPGGQGDAGPPDRFVPAPADLDGALVDAPPDSPPPGGRVEVKGGELFIDGRATFLYGGEVQYFRIRDRGFDATRTEALWADTLVKMKAAHMNLVATYFPWDYHSPREGAWDFTGARDAKRFLELACKAGMKVIAKPGPLITAEWPGGFGTFGAVPEWWKQAHPRSLVKKANGDTYNYSPTGTDGSQVQPTYLDAEYLSAVEAWYDQIVPIMKPFVASRCVIAVQVDNETNLYWGNRFGDVDYSAPSLAHYRAFLAGRYPTIAALNSAYRTSYGSFAGVVPPGSAPGRPEDNLAARDWYEAGHAYSLTYLKTLRAMLEKRGLREPEILFMTNDSPFGLPARTVMVHDGAVKNQVGLAGVDLYPKQYPTNGELVDQPYQVDYFTKIFGENSGIYTRDSGRYTFGAELQGGFYSFPLGIKPNVLPEATGQLLAKTIGHGMKGGSFYVLRGGLNIDGSSYDFQGALSPEGEPRPRYEVMSRWGNLVSTYERQLSSSDEVEEPVYVVQDTAYAMPQAGTQDDHQSLFAYENAGVFGWLVNAGYNPRVVDIARSDLSGARVAFFLLPQQVDDATADKLVAFHQRGGVLVVMLDPGSANLAGNRSASVQKLAQLFDARADGSYSWPGIPLRSGSANQKLAGAEGATRTYWYQTYWQPSPGAAPLVVERTQPFGTDGKVIAFTRSGGGAPRAFLGAHFGAVFNNDSYYRADADELEKKRSLARHLVGLAGVTPALRPTGLREEAWARRARGPDGPLFVFVVSGHDASTVHVDLLSASRLGLDPARRYSVKDPVLGGPTLTRTGADLVQRGLDVPLLKHGATALVIEPAP